LAGRKDELLGHVDSDTLLRLAESVSESPMKSGVTRAELLKIVKRSLSIEEIRRKAKQMGGGPQSGELTRRELMAGGVGQILLAVSGVVDTAGFLTAIYLGLGYRTIYGFSEPASLVSSVIFLVFVLLLMVSIVRITRGIGGRGLGAATCLFGLAAALTGIICGVLLTLTPPQEYYGVGLGNVLVGVYIVIYPAFVGITMTLLGAFILTCREYSPNSDLWMAGGIVYIVSGGSQFSIIASYYIPIGAFVSGIIGAICFLTKRVERKAERRVEREAESKKEAT
jgi:hypothetical protein